MDVDLQGCLVHIWRTLHAVITGVCPGHQHWPGQLTSVAVSMMCLLSSDAPQSLMFDLVNSGRAHISVAVKTVSIHICLHVHRSSCFSGICLTVDLQCSVTVARILAPMGALCILNAAGSDVLFTDLGYSSLLSTSTETK